MMSIEERAVIALENIVSELSNANRYLIRSELHQEQILNQLQKMNSLIKEAMEDLQ